MARDLAGFSAGQGELLRRALSAKRATEAIERLRSDFLSGAQANGVSVEIAETVFDQLRAFGGYSFAKSHAAAFAVLVYQSAWLKYYHLLPFYTALLNNQPMGFWTPAVLVNEIKRKGRRVLPVDIHHSQPRCSLEAGGIRLGLNYVKGLSEAQIERIVACREEKTFTSLSDFCKRTRLGPRVTENLVVAGAMDGWGLPRRQLLWELGTFKHQEGALELEFVAEEVSLPTLMAVEALVDEQSVLGLSAGEHVMAHLRPRLSGQGVSSSAQVAVMSSGARARIAGLLVVHQAPPTAKGFHFLTLEDEEGLMDVIVRPQLYPRYRRILHTAHLLLVEGEVQREGKSCNVLAQRIVAL